MGKGNKKRKPGRPPPSLLQKQVDAFLGKLSYKETIKLKRNIQSFGSFKVQSMCSGSELIEALGGTLFKTVVNTKGRVGSGKGKSLWNTVFTCEEAPRKQRWIRQYMWNGADSVCLFNDVRELCKNPVCVVHSDKKADGGMCGIQAGHLAVAGFSCKNLSKYNVDHMKSKKSGYSVLQHLTGTSGQTLRGVLDFLQRYKTPVYIGENVEDVVSLESGNAQSLLELFANIGYVVDFVVLRHSDYMGCTTRNRVYIVALNVERARMTPTEARDTALHSMPL